MLEDHRSGPRHDSLLSTYPEDDSNSGWMISYIDIMTLLVALFVIIIAAAGVTGPNWAPDEPVADTSTALTTPLEVPLPTLLEERRQSRPLMPTVVPGELNPMAISAALGVAGLPPRVARSPSAPPLLALPADADAESSSEWNLVASLTDSRQARRPSPSLSQPLPRLPTPLLQVEAPSEALPLADYMVLLTDRPPVNVREVSDEAISGALALMDNLAERVDTSPYLPNLEGVEVSRVAEGISLRVQDRLLFPSATAELTQGGASLVGSLLETIQRYEGEVWVEGHSDSQTINTPEFSSNWALSSARAIAIVEALEAAGVAAERLRAVGLAATQPLEDNSTAEGRARNRRVEVVIHVE
ncbi:OmpA family protein [Vreelandella piezotolerans]|uniref:OmpA family protein n=1 Tax=Vreelandella piezotolerans TaxID=2609667 RepID=A0ABQ6XAC0_9GAMM|nr:OmpA family protein [Halomonas piezotolerans]KAE8438954.1 OmpA family protein [Halomonas piezotolerans]QJA24722.1 OmpA family protein [Halomonas piezotolerans]